MSRLPAANAANKQNATTAKNAPVEQSAEPELHYYPFNLALWHRVLEWHRDSESSRFALHLGLGYGRVGAVRGFGFDVLHHRSDVETRGASGSLGWTRVSRTQGVAWSFGVVTAERNLNGVDFAGLVALREGDVWGAQVAGLASIESGSLTGAQTAALFTKHDGPLRGVQFAYGANSADTVEGVQFAAVNVANDVHGVQFGLVNVAHRVDGVAIGLVNISDNVRTQAELWSERNYLENVGVRYLYSPLTFGISTGYDSLDNRVRFWQLWACASRISGLPSRPRSTRASFWNKPETRRRLTAEKVICGSVSSGSSCRECSRFQRVPRWRCARRRAKRGNCCCAGLRGSRCFRPRFYCNQARSTSIVHAVAVSRPRRMISVGS